MARTKTPSPSSPAERIEELSRLIEHHNHLYYVEARIEISCAAVPAMRRCNDNSQRMPSRPPVVMVRLIAPESPMTSGE